MLLTANIGKAQSLEELAEVLQGAHGPLNHIHVTAIIVRLADMAEALHAGRLRGVRPAFTLTPAVAPGSSSHSHTSTGTGAGKPGARPAPRLEGQEEEEDVGDEGVDEGVGSFELDAPFPVALEPSGGADPGSSGGPQAQGGHPSRAPSGGAGAGGQGGRARRARLPGTRAQALRQVLAHALAVLEPLAPDLDARGVVNVLHAMARMRMAKHALAVELVGRAAPLLEDLNSQVRARTGVHWGRQQAVLHAEAGVSHQAQLAAEDCGRTRKRVSEAQRGAAFLPCLPACAGLEQPAVGGGAAPHAPAGALAGGVRGGVATAAAAL